MILPAHQGWLWHNLLESQDLLVRSSMAALVKICLTVLDKHEQALFPAYWEKAKNSEYPKIGPGWACELTYKTDTAPNVWDIRILRETRRPIPKVEDPLPKTLKELESELVVISFLDYLVNRVFNKILDILVQFSEMCIRWKTLEYTGLGLINTTISYHSLFLR